MTSLLEFSPIGSMSAWNLWPMICLCLVRDRYRMNSIASARGVTVETRHHTRYNLPFGVIQNLNCVELGAPFIVWFCTVLAAQESASCHGCPALNSTRTTTLPKFPDDRVVAENGLSTKSSADPKLCSIQPFPGLAGLATVDSLELPPKAQKEYGAACSALKNHRLSASEQHLRKALQISPK